MSTKTEAVRDHVFQMILAGEYQPGECILPEREMAQVTGTSRVTVRRAYAELERAGVLMRRQGSGARIATTATAHARRVDTVAVLASLRDPFAVDFIEAMESALEAHGGVMLLKLTEQNPDKERRAAVDLAVRGHRDMVVWPSGGCYDRALFARLRAVGCNLVFFDRMLPDGAADYVGLDNGHAVNMLLDHAVSQGVRRAVFVSHTGLSADTDRLREEAFERCCRRLSLDCCIERVAWEKQGGSTLDPVALGAPAATTAFVAVNDALALQIRHARPEARVYGIDGLGKALSQGIITVRQPMREMAREAVAMLVRQQKDILGWQPTRRFIRGELVLPAGSHPA